jgi:restriction endonuclease Mrr
MLPLLRLAEDGRDHALKDSVSFLADHFRLTDPEKSELLPSGQQDRFHNRVAWANTCLEKTALLYPRHGLDGIIKEDRLGLDVIYVQAKRWSAMVGRPEIQKFSGALHGQHANKGILITTSDFSREADEHVLKIGSKFALIDDVRLAELMIDLA